MDLVSRHEKKLFRFGVVISAIFWLVLIGATFGVALIYLLFFFIFYLFAQSAFITMLKGNGVRISENQYPDLNRRVTQCCDKLGMTDIPDAYLLRTDFFNALATKFLGRHYVVLFTDVVDALEKRPDAIDFYIGHELGHIDQKHLTWGWFLFPAMMLPILGAAYRRAQEYTCDRYGSECCNNEDDIKAAIAAIAAGDTYWKSINTNAYIKQASETSQFWMSFHELTGDYPWLTKRLASALAFKRGEGIAHPHRNKFAWILSAFIPRFGGGGGTSLLITVMIIGVLAAVSIPAYQDYVLRAQNQAALMNATGVKAAVESYAIENEVWPTSLSVLGYETDTIKTDDGNAEISLYENGVVGIQIGTDENGDAEYIVLEPAYNGEEFEWDCYGENVAMKYLPTSCR